MTMTIEDGEKMIVDKIYSARHRVRELETQARIAKQNLDAARSHLSDIEQAAIDYMEGNGLISTEAMRVGESMSINVDDIDAVPERYIRLKKEINKSLIKQETLDANWYTQKSTKFIVLKGEK